MAAAMDAEAAEILARIHAEQREAGERVWPPATPDDLSALVGHARTALRAEVPEGYLALLRVCDGLDFNGTTLYATRERRADGLTLLGFPEQNHTFRAQGAPRHHVLFGETGDELFAQDQARGDFAILDRGSLSEQERFADFDALLRRVLRRAFEG